MRITFLAIGTEQLAISLMAAILKQNGHQVSVAFTPALFNDRWNLELPGIAKFFKDEALLLEKVKEQEPDVIAFSCLTSSYKWSLELAEKIKVIFPNVKTIFGGVHISAVPDRAIKKKVVDFAVVGEGEIAIQRILECIETGNYDEPIVNTLFKSKDGTVVRGKQSGFNQDLDDLPWYDKSIWDDYLRMDKYMTMASRGCPYRCSFCFNNFFAKLPEDKSTKGKYVRLRSIPHLIAELKWAKARYGQIKYIDFQDDIFTTSKKWLREFVVEYKKHIDIPFQCLTHPKYMDEEVAELISSAGCHWVQMGVQSMDDTYKEKILRLERSEHIEEACRVMNKYGIKAKLDHMFGLPGEPISAQEKALNLYKKYPPNRIQTFWTCFLPGTDLLKEGLENGDVTEAQAEMMYEGDNFYFYRNDENITNHKYRQELKGYEFIFKILPLLSYKRRMNISVNKILWIPEFVRDKIAFLADLYTGLRFGNPDFMTYLWHYLYQMRRFVMWKIFNKRIKPNMVLNDVDPLLAFEEFKKQNLSKIEI